jgi:hypothetical protein
VERDSLENIGVNGKIIELIFKKWVGEALD